MDDPILYGGLEIPSFELLYSSEVGGRTLSRSVVYASTVRGGVVMLYGRSRVGVVVPVPRYESELVEILKGADRFPVDRALKSPVRQKILMGSIIGILVGKRKEYEPIIPDAFMVPYPFTIIVAERTAERVWGIVEQFPLPSKREMDEMGL